MKLWQIPYTLVRKGTYQVRVVVVASDRNTAVEKACRAFEAHVSEHIADLGVMPDMDGHLVDEDDPSFQSMLKDRFADFRAEAIMRLEHVPDWEWLNTTPDDDDEVSISEKVDRLSLTDGHVFV